MILEMSIIWLTVYILTVISGTELIKSFVRNAFNVIKYGKLIKLVEQDISKIDNYAVELNALEHEIEKNFKKMFIAFISIIILTVVLIMITNTVIY